MQSPQKNKIILFDGICNLCSNMVQFVIEHDKEDIFRFAALQSAVGRKLMADRGIDPSPIDSIVLIEPGIAYYTKSTAALKIARSLGGIWGLARLLEWLPEGIRNRVYDHIAKNRYKWYGKKEACMVPTPELMSKFLDQE
ncbi:MAG TPA: thiol-disulfide oxidoreductase DCC family protein [Arenibacter sp.]|nr:thiol-disulfide oxidoreductase DCC family protein [Arenibacter sp.]